MNLAEKFRNAWFDYKDNKDLDSLPSLLDDSFEWESLTKTFNNKSIETKTDTLETLHQINTTTKSEIFYSNENILVMRVHHLGKNINVILLISVIFENGKAIKMLSARGEPA